MTEQDLWRVVFEDEINGCAPEAKDFDDGYEIVGASDAEHAVSEACGFRGTSWQAWVRSPTGDVTAHVVTKDWAPVVSTTERTDTSDLREIEDIKRLVESAKFNASGRQLLMWHADKLSVWYGFAERWKGFSEELEERHLQLAREADEWKRKAEREAELRVRDYAVVLAILLLAGVVAWVLDAAR